jgi:hypothetical protein
MTFYTGPVAERAMMDGMILMYEYRDLIFDLIAFVLGYMAWCNFKDFNSTEQDVWTGIQLRYETLYYIRGAILDYNKWRVVHHVLCLGYLYWGWAFKTALSTAFYFSAVSNCWLALMQKHPNKFTKVAFAVSFVIARIIYGTWLMKNILYLPVKGSQVLVIPMTGTIYVMQWWWLYAIGRHVRKAFKGQEAL